MQKRVLIKTKTTRSLASPETQEGGIQNNITAIKFEPEEDILETTYEGTVTVEDGIFTLSYTDILDYGRVYTRLSFALDDPKTVAINRDGAASISLVFKSGQRHICCFNTPIMRIELCTNTKKLINGLHVTGMLRLEYVIEIHGAITEKTKMVYRISDLD